MVVVVVGSILSCTDDVAEEGRAQRWGEVGKVVLHGHGGGGQHEEVEKIEVKSIIIKTSLTWWTRVKLRDISQPLFLLMNQKYDGSKRENVVIGGNQEEEA